MVDTVIMLSRLRLKIIFKSESQNLRMTTYIKMTNKIKNPQPYNSSADLHSYDNNECCDFFYNGGGRQYDGMSYVILYKKPLIGKALYPSFNKDKLASN